MCLIFKIYGKQYQTLFNRFCNIRLLFNTYVFVIAKNLKSLLFQYAYETTKIFILNWAQIKYLDTKKTHCSCTGFF
jgi:hypothetical protein